MLNRFIRLPRNWRKAKTNYFCENKNSETNPFFPAPTKNCLPYLVIQILLQHLKAKEFKLQVDKPGKMAAPIEKDNSN